MEIERRLLLRYEAPSLRQKPPELMERYNLVPQGLSAEMIALLKPNAIVVNISRGQLVDEEALTDALVHNRIGGAAGQALADAARTSFIHAMDRGLLAGAIVAMAGALVSLIWLPSRPKDAEAIEAELERVTDAHPAIACGRRPSKRVL